MLAVAESSAREHKRAPYCWHLAFASGQVALRKQPPIPALEEPHTMLMLMCQPRLAHAFVELGRGSKELAAAAGELACSAEELAGDVAGLARSSGGDGGGRGKLGCVNGGGESVMVALGQSFTRPSAWPNFSQWSRSLDQSQSSSLPWQNAFSRSG